MSFHFEIKLSVTKVDKENRISVMTRTVTAASLDTLEQANDLFDAIEEQVKLGSITAKLLQKDESKFQLTPPSTPDAPPETSKTPIPSSSRSAISQMREAMKDVNRTSTLESADRKNDGRN